jgi:hypothetical protein
MNTSSPSISRQELLAQINDPQPGFRLVEALPAQYYAEAHLPGALNMPLDDIEVLAPLCLRWRVRSPSGPGARKPHIGNGVASEVRPSHERIGTKGRKDHEEMMVIEGKQASEPEWSWVARKSVPDAFEIFAILCALRKSARVATDCNRMKDRSVDESPGPRF